MLIKAKSNTKTNFKLANPKTKSPPKKCYISRHLHLSVIRETPE